MLLQNRLWSVFCTSPCIVDLITCICAKCCSLTEHNFFFLLDLTPRFISEPLSTVQKSGGSVQLRCSAEPSTARLSWLFHGEPLDSKVGEVEIQSGSLTIVSLSLSTSGRYQCVANSSVGAVVSRPATVSMGSKLIFLYILCSLQLYRPQLVCMVCFSLAFRKHLKHLVSRCGVVVLVFFFPQLVLRI